MAASGIAEHDEARRKEIVYLRKAYYMQEQEHLAKEQKRQSLLDQATGHQRYAEKPTAYENQVNRMRELGLIGNSNDPKSMDRERRLAHYEKTKNDYSAKIQNRYSSVDYQTQW